RPGRRAGRRPGRFRGGDPRRASRPQRSVIVVDASVVVSALADDGADGDLARARLRGERLAAPGLIDLEVVSAWRRMVAAGDLDTRRAAFAIGDLRAMRIERVAHGALLERCWELRGNLTVYDAAYVALAEMLEAVLLTADGRLARAAASRCTIEHLE
ncbi:MAG: type II toxin-antitoxin system VapC family toxin, partial [Acidimicrobiales bacterium]